MKITGTAAKFLESNVDTDIIMPARFLKRIYLDGFEPFAFFEKRFSKETVCEPNVEKKDFVFERTVPNPNCSLNHPNAKNANILITWENFGCGSSREHAVYGLRNYKVIIGSAPQGKSAFADIFRDNCKQNLIWTPIVNEADHRRLCRYYDERIDAAPVELVVDVQEHKIFTPDGILNMPFDMPKHMEVYILEGKDPYHKARHNIVNSLQVIQKWNESNQKLLGNSPDTRLTREVITA